MPDYKAERRCGRMNGCHAASGVRAGGFEAEAAGPHVASSRAWRGERRERQPRVVAVGAVPANPWKRSSNRRQETAGAAADLASRSKAAMSSSCTKSSFFRRFLPASPPSHISPLRALSKIIVILGNSAFQFPLFNFRTDRLNSPVTKCYGVCDVGRRSARLSNRHRRAVRFCAACGSADRSFQALIPCSCRSGCTGSSLARRCLFAGRLLPVLPLIRSGSFSSRRSPAHQVLLSRAESRHDAR
ncbi:hypothetical protein B0G69_4639 [Paraburkholderia sp. RAU2J]|nr:hypothetical protein B0G69_4639 [Paraburkholderia sp. RAU2J]